MGQMMRSKARRGGLAGLALLAIASTPAKGQSFDLGLGAAFYVDVPEPFSDRYCDESPVGLTGSAAWRVLGWLAVEGNASINGNVGGVSCAIADLAPVPFDVPVVERVWPDEVYGSSFFATHFSAVVEPFSSWSVSPRARIGFGRIWDKDVNDRLLGLGVRYRFGRHALVTDLDAWRFTVLSEEWTVIYRVDGPPEIVSQETIEHDFRPLVVRIGWEVSLGR
jgi:hypothetical protein